MKIAPDNDNISIATGLVNPKTTSLFYDKIWIPDSLKDTDIYQSEYGKIPSEVQTMGDRDIEERLYFDCPFGYYSVMNTMI